MSLPHFCPSKSGHSLREFPESLSPRQIFQSFLTGALIPSQYRHTRTTREHHKHLQMGIKDDLDRFIEIAIFFLDEENKYQFSTLISTL